MSSSSDCAGIRRLCLKVVILLVFLGSSLPVAAQDAQIRVLANQATIRLRPDPNSPTVATIAAGTVLDLRGTEGAWYSVWLPPEPTAGRRAGYLAMSDAEAFSPTPVAPSRRPTSRVTSAPPVDAALSDWQSRYNNAARRRSAGWKKFWIGTSVVAAGSVMATIYASGGSLDCSRNVCDFHPPPDALYYTAYSAVIGGGVVGLWGIMQSASAGSELERLEIERRAAAGGTANPSAGYRRFQVNYTVRW